MSTRTHRRWWVRISSYVVVLVAVLGIYAVRNYNAAENYRFQVQSNYERSLSDLNDYVNNIQVSLNKGLYANTPPMVNEIATSLWRESAGAKSSMGQLPISEFQLENTYKFLSQVGEYALYLSKKTTNGEVLSEEEHQQMIQLAQLSTGLADHISKMRGQLDDGMLDFQKTETVLMAGGKANDMNYIGDGMTDTEESMVDYPTLVYDGPFADHLMNRNPKMIQGQPEITRDSARAIASKYLGVDVSEILDSNDEDGVMPSFGFTAGSTSISITKNGGLLCYFRNPRDVGEMVMSQEDAVRTATSYLEKNGFTNMKESYYMTANGECIVNFAFVQDDVILYPDLIKVGVALDTGEILSFESRGFLMNHTKRDLPSPKYTFENAKAVISPYLAIIDYRKALVPMPTGKEELCYEFHCKGSNGEEVLVYINTQTCQESQILLMLYTDGGVLTK